MPVTEQERTLIAGCLKGEKLAWDAFVCQYSGLIYHTIKKTFSLHHAEPMADSIDDLFQEIFLSLLKDDLIQLRRFRGDNGCTLASWLRMIAARRTIDLLRKSTRNSDEDLQNLKDAVAEPEASNNEQTFQLLTKALATLSPSERIIINLFCRENLSAQEIASILHLSIGAVYTQKSRVLAKLREALKNPDAL